MLQEQGGPDPGGLNAQKPDPEFSVERADDQPEEGRRPCGEFQRGQQADRAPAQAQDAMKRYSGPATLFPPTQVCGGCVTWADPFLSVGTDYSLLSGRGGPTPMQIYKSTMNFEKTTQTKAPASIRKEILVRGKCYLEMHGWCQ